jgi:hypothetical protein
MWRMLIVAGLVLGIAMVGFPQPASACSCVVMDADRFLEESDAAFIGTVRSSEIRSVNEDAIWLFEVEQTIKGDPGETVEVRTPAERSMCGLSLQEGDRTGMFLNQHDGKWHSSVCSLVVPDALLAAAEDLPPPTAPADPAPATDEPGAPDWLLALLIVILIGAGIRLGLVWLSRRSE